MILSLLLACNDNTLVYEKEVLIYEDDPQIVVIPEEINFGHINAETFDQEEVYIINSGSYPLYVSDISLTGDHSLQLIDNVEKELLPGERYSFIVNYDPITYEENYGSISITSTDPDEEIVEIPITGFGDAPVIFVNKTEMYFDDEPIACEVSEDITIRNVGNLDLEVEEIIVFGSIPNNYSLELNEPINGALTWDIPPSGFKTFSLEYTPEDLIDDLAVIQVNSNDPLRPVVEAFSEGNGIIESYGQDRFRQEYSTEVDVLFVLDNSGSMHPFQMELINNFSSFLSVFTQLNVDYRIALITTDNANFVGNGYIDSTNQDPVGYFVNLINIAGTSGSGLERGLEYSYQSFLIGPASPNGNFFRQNASLSVIYISDEGDHSSSPISFYLNFFDALKAPGLFSAHAVIGDYPSGCNYMYNNMVRTAAFGSGYYDVVQYYSGNTYSICATDWGLQMQNLAFNAAPQTMFELSDLPIEDSIEVMVDGVVDYNWSYDPQTNSINFNTSNIPPEGSYITVSYGLFAECN